MSEENHTLWKRIQKDGNIVYRPNSEHPSITGFADALPEEFRHGFRACITLIGSGLPIAALHADMLGGAERVASDVSEFDEFAEAAEMAVRALKGTSMTGSDVVKTLCSTEPFVNHKNAIRCLVEDMEQGETSCPPS